jgi:hypothetical protein
MALRNESFSPTFSWPVDCYADIAESTGLQLLPGEPDLHVTVFHQQLVVRAHADGLLVTYSSQTPIPQVEHTEKGSSGHVALTREVPSPFVVTHQGVFVRLDDTPDLQAALERRRNPFGDVSAFPAEFQRELGVFGEMDSFANVQIRTARDWQCLMGDFLGDRWTPGETRQRSTETLGLGRFTPINTVVRTITFDGDVDYAAGGVRRCVKFSGTMAVDGYPNATKEEYSIFDADTMRPLETGAFRTMHGTAPRSATTAALPLERVVTRRRYRWTSR